MFISFGFTFYNFGTIINQELGIIQNSTNIVSPSQAVSIWKPSFGSFSQKLLVLSSVHVGCWSNPSSPDGSEALSQATNISAIAARGNMWYLCFIVRFSFGLIREPLFGAHGRPSCLWHCLDFPDFDSARNVSIILFSFLFPLGLFYLVFPSDYSITEPSPRGRS